MPQEEQNSNDEKSRQIVQLPELYPAQQSIKDEAKRFSVLCIGRRAGKTYLGINLALESALAGHPVGWFSPTYKYVLEVWRDLLRPVKDVTSKVNATERRIEFPNGGLIEVWSLDNEDAGRSRKYKRAIIDEAAMAPNLKNAWEESIRPTLTDLQGDVWFLSTPKGLNYFHDLFNHGQDTLRYPDWCSWQMPSSVNPYLPMGEIEAMRQEMPEMAFRQEILAEFLSGEGAVFRNVDACLTALTTRPDAHRDHIVVAGVDWGRQHDFTAISIVCCHCRQEIYLDRFNQIGWDFQRQRLLAALKLWLADDCLIETNSIGGPNLEAMYQIAPDSISLRGFQTTPKSKPPLIQSLALAFEKSEIRWLPDQAAKHELIAYEATITETGHVRYGAPEGGFDDTVIARALAWRAASQKLPIPIDLQTQIELAIPTNLRLESDAPHTEGWEMARSHAISRAEKQIEVSQYSDYELNWRNTV